MKKSILGIVAMVGVVAVSGMLVANVFAAKPADNTRPGWGKGDTNHIHVGPPGQSVRP